MQIQELTATDTHTSDNLFDTLQQIKASGNSTSAGEVSVTSSARAVSAQYPAARSMGNGDSRESTAMSDLYSNGLQFKAYHFESRKTTDLGDVRKNQNGTLLDSLVESAKDSVGRSTNGVSTTGKEKNMVCNILMPRSKSDVDSVSHKFNDVADSLMTKGGGTVGGAISNMASTSVFGALESMTQGMFADRGEQLYNASRAMYSGADFRTKVFTWDLTPRTVDDLVQILLIYDYFTYFSYGVTGNSAHAKEIKKQLDEAYKESFLKKVTPEGADLSDTVVEGITSFLSNVIVISNPTIWVVKNFGDGNSSMDSEDIFGPCQIQSIRLDKSPDGNFAPLQIAPNLPSSFQLEVTMREVIQLNRRTWKNGGM